VVLVWQFWHHGERVEPVLELVEDPLVGVVMAGFVELACEVVVACILGELTGDLADLGTIALLIDLNEECAFSSRA